MSDPQLPETLAEAIQMAADGRLVLLDVRETAELQASGTAAGAVHIPLSQVALRAAELPEGPVGVFCAAGARAGQAVQILEGMARAAVNLGGFGQWVQAGGPVVRL